MKHRLCLFLPVRFALSYSVARVTYVIQQRVFLVLLYFKYESAGKRRRKFGAGFQENQFQADKVRLQTLPRKSLKRVAQATSVSETSARNDTKLLKLLPCKTIVVHALKGLDAVAKIQSVRDGGRS
jgi:hypothetical protein